MYRKKIFFNGGDVDENRHFIEGKLVAHGQFPQIENMGARLGVARSDFIYTKNSATGKSDFIYTRFSWGAMLTK